MITYMYITSYYYPPYYETVCSCCFTSGSLLVSCSRNSLATYHDSKHPVRFMHLDLTKARLLTCGGDRIVKVSCFIFLEKTCLSCVCKRCILVRNAASFSPACSPVSPVYTKNPLGTPGITCSYCPSQIRKLS